MGLKESTRLEVVDVDGQVVGIPVGVAKGSGDGSVLTVIGGVHGTEYAAQQAVAEFWSELDPAEIRGEVRVVLCADVVAAESHSAYANPLDGKNLNRVWPGDANGTLTERIAHRITSAVVTGSSVLLDVHGGEWDEDIDCFVIAQRSGHEDRDALTVALAMELGFAFVEVTSGEEALGRGTASGAAAASGLLSLTLEAGGRGLRQRRHVDAHKNALENALRHLGIKEGRPVRWNGGSVMLAGGITLRTTVSGLFHPVVTAGQWIEHGEMFATVRGYEGQTLEEMRAPRSGVVLDVIIARGIQAGGFAGKVGVLAEQ